MPPSINRIYKDSGTTLSFKEWIEREKAKYANMDGTNIDTTSGLSQAFNQPITTGIKDTIANMQTAGGLASNISNKTVLGIPKNVLIFAGIVIVGAVAYKLLRSGTVQTST